MSKYDNELAVLTGVKGEQVINYRDKKFSVGGTTILRFESAGSKLYWLDWDTRQQIYSLYCSGEKIGEYLEITEPVYRDGGNMLCFIGKSASGYILRIDDKEIRIDCDRVDVGEKIYLYGNIIKFAATKNGLPAIYTVKF